MPAYIHRHALALLLAASCCSPAAFAQAPAPAEKPADFEPQSGQAGKDVVWVPTLQVMVDKMLNMAKVTSPLRHG